MGTIITALLAILILGYAGYQIWHVTKKSAEGKCVGCEHAMDGCSCSLIDQTPDEETDNKN